MARGKTGRSGARAVHRVPRASISGSGTARFQSTTARVWGKSTRAVLVSPTAQVRFTCEQQQVVLFEYKSVD